MASAITWFVHSSCQTLAVDRIDAHLHGHKLPEMDWTNARAIALSEYVGASNHQRETTQ
jgi:hypothetical protein